MNRKGVTLLELIIVMVIIAIGATLLVPGIGAWIPTYRLRGATRDVVSTLRTAQMKAVSTNLEYRVYFNPGERKYWIERGNQSSDSTNWGQPDAKEGGDVFLPTGILINSTSNNIEFNPDSSCSTPRITLSNSKNSTRTITLASTTGRIKVEPPL